MKLNLGKWLATVGLTLGVCVLVADAAETAAPAFGPRLAQPRSDPGPGGRSPSLPTGGVLLDSYAAIVKDKVVTVGDVLSQARPLHAHAAATLEGNALAAELARIYIDVREDLVGVQLTLLEFEALGATLPEHSIDDRVNMLIRERFHGNRAELLEAIAESRMTISEWREQLRQQLIVELMRNREVTSKISVSPIDIQAEYAAHPDDYAVPEQVQLEVVSIRSPRPSNPVEVEQARDFYRRLLRVSYGTTNAPVDAPALRHDFPRLDVRYEPVAGWLAVDSLAPAFQEGIKDVMPGRIASPVDLQGRSYFLRVADRKAPATVTLEEAAPAIERRLRNAKEQELMESWIDTLRAKYHVQYFDHALFQAPADYDPEDDAP